MVVTIGILRFVIIASVVMFCIDRICECIENIKSKGDNNNEH